jgi:hypothetical protein
MFSKEKALEVFNSISTYDELKTLFDVADNANIHLGSAWDAHKRLIQRIVSRNNPLGLIVPRSLSDPKFEDSTNYVEFEQTVKNHFAQFGVDQAISERMDKIYIDARFQSYPRTKTLNEVIALGYVAHPNCNPENSWYAYDLSKPLKLRFKGSQSDLNHLLALIGGPELPYFSEYTFPSVPETDEYIIHPNRKVQFKNLELASRLRDLLMEKYKNVTNHLIKL